jgi:hypothetical protein
VLRKKTHSPCVGESLAENPPRILTRSSDKVCVGDAKLSLTVENFLICSFVHSSHAIRMMHHVLCTAS